MKRIIAFIISLLPLIAWADTVELLEQYKIDNYVPAGNYSGIAAIGEQLSYIGEGGHVFYENDYAVVSDKAEWDGFYVWHIKQDGETGQIVSVSLVDTLRHGEVQNHGSNCDYEGVAYLSNTNTLFISDEATQRIYEHDLRGVRTGRELAIPEQFSRTSINSNYGFESLTYSAYHQRFFTTTENTLKADGRVSSNTNRVEAMLRIQAFDTLLQPQEQYVYLTDTPRVVDATSMYAFGVPALLADDTDGTLLVLEREFAVGSTENLSTFVNTTVVYNKLYRVQLTDTNTVLQKERLTTWQTSILGAPKNAVANYEGMGWGATLEDGTRTILLVNDSQDRYSRFNQSLSDYIKVIRYQHEPVITPEPEPEGVEEVSSDAQSWIVITRLGQVIERGTGNCPYSYMYKETSEGMRVYLKN